MDSVGGAGAGSVGTVRRGLLLAACRATATKRVCQAGSGLSFWEKTGSGASVSTVGSKKKGLVALTFWFFSSDLANLLVSAKYVSQTVCP